jgi:hypothetical protein
MHAQFGEDEVHEGDTFESLGCEDGGTVCVDCVALSASAGGDNEGPGCALVASGLTRFAIKSKTRLRGGGIWCMRVTFRTSRRNSKRRQRDGAWRTYIPGVMRNEPSLANAAIPLHEGPTSTGEHAKLSGDRVAVTHVGVRGKTPGKDQLQVCITGLCQARGPVFIIMTTI